MLFLNPRRILWTLSIVLLAAHAPLAAIDRSPAPADLDADRLPEDLFSGLTLRHVGPLGNRVSAVTGVPGTPVLFAGAASGGVWKTDDGGVSWRPVFDDQDLAAIGSLAVSPADPSVVWAGTGETFIRSNISLGNGIYRSGDGGETFEHSGLEGTGRIGRIVAHPRDPGTAWAAAMGDCYGPDTERGVFRTQDGGESWQRVLFVDRDTGASDLAISPRDPRVLVAGTWQMEIRPWGRWSGGPGSGLWITRDGGDSWERLEGSGLPEPPWGKVAVTFAPSDPDRLYALIETSSNDSFAPLPDGEHPGVLWRSNDGGASWEMANADHTLVQRPLYYSRAQVSPDDADEIRFMAVQMSVSTDAGATFDRVEDSGGDHHDLWIDPTDGDRMIVGHDQGVSITTNRGESWFRPQLPIAQMYHVATDRAVPYRLYGNRQDGPSTSGPSNSLTDGEIPIGAWSSVGGCETGFAVPDTSGATVWTGCYDGILERFDRSTGRASDVSVWPLSPETWPAEGLRYRFQWTFPLAKSPHPQADPAAPPVLFAGSQIVHRSEDGGLTWTDVSPDLTGDDPDKQTMTGGLTHDDAGPTLAPTLFALAESPLERGQLWAGTNDGRLQKTDNAHDPDPVWTDLTARLPDLPPWGTVSNIEPSPHDPAVVTLTVDRHQMGDTAPYVFRSVDGGATFRRIDGDIPRSTHSYAHVVREDPARPGLLYLGTENALYVSFDAGRGWAELGTPAGLPPAPVHWIEVQPDFGDLVVATYGRGFWILDDLSPIRQLSAETLAASPHLFAPRPAYRFRSKESPMSQPGDPAAGENPEYGALLHYHLGEPADDAGEPTVEIEILDAAGEVIRTLDELPTEPGLHRVAWDLTHDETTEVKLRTRPLEHAHETVPEDPGYRELSDASQVSLLAAPGEYTVRLRVEEIEQTAPLTVRLDPGSGGTEESIATQQELLVPLADAVDRMARLINEIEWWRHDLAAQRGRLTRDRSDLTAGLSQDAPDAPDAPEVSSTPETSPEVPGTTEGADRLAEIEALETELEALEGELFDLRLTTASQDILRWRRLLLSRLVYLFGFVQRSDFAPTAAHREVAHLLLQEVGEVERRWSEIRRASAEDDR